MNCEQTRRTRLWDPEQPTLWESCLYAAKGDDAKSEELLTGLIARPCGDWRLLGAAYYHRACIYIVRGEFEKAKADIEKIGKPCVYLKRLALGDLNYYQEKYKEAAQEYEEAIVRLPQTRIPNSEPLKALRTSGQTRMPSWERRTRHRPPVRSLRSSRPRTSRRLRQERRV